MWNELILNLMKAMMGEGGYYMFMRLFAEMPEGKRTITLPSKRTMLAHDKKYLVWIYGLQKEERERTDAEMSWGDVAKKVNRDLEEASISAEEARRIYKQIKLRNLAWIDLGYAELYQMVKEAKGYQRQELREEMEGTS